MIQSTFPLILFVCQELYSELKAQDYLYMPQVQDNFEHSGSCSWPASLFSST